MTAQTNTRRRGPKPSKPYADFPLTANGNGQWSKKIRGKVRYFGPWCDWKGAIEEYNRTKDYYYAGQEPPVREEEGALTFKDACNHFLDYKKKRCDAGKLSQVSLEDYLDVCKRLEQMTSVRDRSPCLASMGPKNFADLRNTIDSQYGVYTVSKTLTVLRMILKFAYENELIKKPVKFAQHLEKPSEREFLLHREDGVRRFFEAEELRVLLAAAGERLRLCLLLGINCGFGNTDCLTLPRKAFCLETPKVNWRRQKTGRARSAPLWPQTVAAVKEVFSVPGALSDEGDELALSTRTGKPYRSDNLSEQFKKLQKRCGTYKPQRGFYSLRHTFETIAGGSTDQVAVDYIMGHADNSMAARYREFIEFERLQEVTDHVHNWLYSE